MKALRISAVVLATILVAAIFVTEGLIITIFSQSEEFRNSAVVFTFSVVLFSGGLLSSKGGPRRRVLMSVSALLSLTASAVLLTHYGEPDGYYARMGISLPSWHDRLFRFGVFGFTLLPVIDLLKKGLNQPVETTPAATRPPRLT